MPDFYSIGVEGEERLQRELKGMQADVGQPVRPVARPLSDEVYLMVRGKYSSGGARGTKGAWPRNKASTIERYTAMNRRGFSVLNQPMRRTDALYISEVTRGAPHGVYEVEDDALTLGTDLPYGLIHQRTGREQYDPTEEDAKRFLSVIKRGLVGKFKDRGFDFEAGTGEIPF